MIIVVNQAVGRVQPKALHLGGRVTQNVNQAVIAVGDAASLAIVDEDSVRIVFDYFVKIQRRKFSAEFTIFAR